MEPKSARAAVAPLLGAWLAIAAGCGADAPVAAATVRATLKGELARRDLTMQDFEAVDGASYRCTAAGAGGDVVDLRVWVVGRDVFYTGASVSEATGAAPVDATASRSHPRRSISGSFRCDG